VRRMATMSTAPPAPAKTAEMASDFATSLA